MNHHGSEDLFEMMPSVVKALEELRIAHRILLPRSAENHELTHWIESHVAFAGSSIDWSRIEAHVCEEWSDEATDAVESFRRASSAIDPNATVKVTWSDAAYPAIEMLLKDALLIAGELFEVSFDTYVVQESEGWLLEVYHEGTTCWGFVGNRSDNLDKMGQPQ